MSIAGIRCTCHIVPRNPLQIAAVITTFFDFLMASSQSFMMAATIPPQAPYANIQDPEKANTNVTISSFDGIDEKEEVVQWHPGYR